MDMTLAQMNLEFSCSRWDFMFSLASFLCISISAEMMNKHEIPAKSC